MRKRALIILSVVATLSLIGGMFFINAAKADPPGLAVDGSNGLKVQRFTHPDHDSWWVEVAVDTQRGVNEASSAVYVSGVTRVSKGAGVKRVQVDAIRTSLGGVVQNDYFPSKSFGARDNTPAGCTIGTNLYDDASPVAGCQQIPNRLNSAGDYSPDVSLVRGYSDWRLVPACTVPPQQVATRGFVAVRWADDVYSKFTLRTANVQANEDC